MDQNKEWWIKERMKRTVEKLKAHDFEALAVQKKEDALEEILKYIAPNTRVGVGGSITLRELGVVERLKERGNTVYDHWMPGLSRDEAKRVRKLEMTSDVFLSSVNAVTLNGELVNIDGIGNRVASIIFGPEKVILVAGYNKIVNDIQEGINRAKNVACPANSRRLNPDLPCAKVGRCQDCNSPGRVCRVIVIHERKPALTDILVILAGEELGY